MPGAQEGRWLVLHVDKDLLDLLEAGYFHLATLRPVMLVSSNVIAGAGDTDLLWIIQEIMVCRVLQHICKTK